MIPKQNISEKVWLDVVAKVSWGLIVATVFGVGAATVINMIKAHTIEEKITQKLDSLKDDPKNHFDYKKVDCSASNKVECKIAGVSILNPENNLTYTAKEIVFNHLNNLTFLFQNGGKIKLPNDKKIDVSISVNELKENSRNIMWSQEILNSIKENLNYSKASKLEKDKFFKFSKNTLDQPLNVSFHIKAEKMDSQLRIIYAMETNIPTISYSNHVDFTVLDDNAIDLNDPLTTMNQIVINKISFKLSLHDEVAIKALYGVYLMETGGRSERELIEINRSIQRHILKAKLNKVASYDEFKEWIIAFIEKDPSTQRIIKDISVSVNSDKEEITSKIKGLLIYDEPVSIIVRNTKSKKLSSYIGDIFKDLGQRKGEDIPELLNISVK